MAEALRRAGCAGLQNGSSAPGRVANRLPEPIIAEIVRLRRKRIQALQLKR